MRTLPAGRALLVGEAVPSKTRNRIDLPRFLDQLEREIPAGREVIAISDNFSTRTTQEVSD